LFLVKKETKEDRFEIKEAWFETKEDRFETKKWENN
jgi:hypothetical protein